MDQLPPHGAGPDRWQRLHLWQITPIRDVLWVAAFVLLIWGAYQLRQIFIPVLLALALAYLFHPLITLAHERWRVPRAATVGGLMAGLVLAVAGLAAWIGPLVAMQITDLARNLPRYIESIAEALNIDVSGLERDLRQWGDAIQEDPAGFLAENVGVLFTGTAEAAGFIGGVIGSTLYIVLALVLIPIYFCVFGITFGYLKSASHQFLPETHRDEVLRIAGQMDRAVSGFFRGRVIVSAILGVLLIVGWSPLLADVPYWLLLGLIAGVLNIVPYLAGIALAIAIMLKWLDVAAGGGEMEWLAILVWPTVVFVVVQLFESWVMTPLIEGRIVNLSAPTVLLVVLLGGAAGGIFGLLVAIPITACAKILLVEVFLPRVRHWAAEH